MTFKKSPWLLSRHKERRVEGSKPLGSPRNAKGTPPRKPLSGLRNAEAKGLSRERGKEPVGPSQGALRAPGAGVKRSPARGTPAPQGLPSLLQTGSPILASAKPSPVPPPPPIGSAAGECHAGPDLREGRGASRMCPDLREAPGSKKGTGGNQEARQEEVSPGRQAPGCVQGVGGGLE